MFFCQALQPCRVASISSLSSSLGARPSSRPALKKRSAISLDTCPNSAEVNSSIKVNKSSEL